MDLEYVGDVAGLTPAPISALVRVVEGSFS